MGAVSWPAAARARPRRKWAPPQGAPRSWHIALRAPDSQLTHKIGTHPPTRTPGHAAGRWEQLVDPWSRPTPTLGGCKTEKHDCRPQRASTPQLTAQRPSLNGFALVNLVGKASGPSAPAVRSASALTLGYLTSVAS